MQNQFEEDVTKSIVWGSKHTRLDYTCNGKRLLHKSIIQTHCDQTLREDIHVQSKPACSKDTNKGENDMAMLGKGS